MKFSLSITPHKQKNLSNVCAYLLDHIGLHYTKFNLNNLLNNHLDSLSLLAVKDTLADYGIQSGAITKGEHSYLDFELPFICSIQEEDWPIPAFTVVTNVDENNVQYLDPVTKKSTISSMDKFESIDKGVLLLLDSSGQINESNFNDNLKKERKEFFFDNFPLVIALFSLVYSGWYLVTNYDPNYSWANIGYLFTTCIGVLISTLLIWHEIDQDNTLIKQVCGSGRSKVNCNAVLLSSYSSFFGISWSVWGATYFFMLFFVQILFVNNISFLLITSLLSLIAFPYIVYSIYTQWRVIKQWCTLCLIIQVVLFINGILAWRVFSNSNFNNDLYYLIGYPFVITLIIGLTMFFSLNSLIPLFKRGNESKQFERKLKVIKSNKYVFQFFLKNSEHIAFPTEDLGITIGNPSASNEIIKICNPYCGPCSDMHFKLESIIEKNHDVKIRIIYTATGDDDDITNAPVTYFLATNEALGSNSAKAVLDDWYASDKDFVSFSNRRPMGKELENQRSKIIAMAQWCDAMKVRVTPTLFVNGYALPEDYRIADLQAIFS